MNIEPIHFELPPDVFRIGEALRTAGGRPFLVGGWVRDAILNRTDQKDFDLEVFGLPMERLPKILKSMGSVHAVGRHFGVLKLNTKAASYDISVPRRESNIGKGHKAFLVETDPDMSFEAAAARRDFTLNAMGYDFFAKTLHDPWGGRDDLEKRILRHVGPVFAEDPLRVLRAMQLAGRFDLVIAPETLALCRTLHLAELPRERLWEEFKKLLLQAPRPSRGLVYADPLGVLPTFPELQALVAQGTSGGPDQSIGAGTLSPWEGTLAMLDHAAGFCIGDEILDLVLMTAALCHRMDAHLEGKLSLHQARAFMARLTNEKQIPEGVVALLSDLETPCRLFGSDAPVAPGTLRRLALRISLPFLHRAATAHHRAYGGEGDFEAGARLKARAMELGVWDTPPEPLLKGRHLLARGMPPGPEVGDWVRRAFDHQMDEGFSTVDEVLTWMAAEPGSPIGAHPHSGKTKKENPNEAERPPGRGT